MSSYNGVIYGVIFCLISAAFDVFVAYLTQSINSAIVIFYCFISSTLLFMMISIFKGIDQLIVKVRKNTLLVLIVNISILLNWGGLIISLRFLEPAIVGVASVACGPAITILLSSFIDKNEAKTEKLEVVISWLVLIGVGVMLVNVFLGNSGLSSTSTQDRIIGIVSVIIGAVGTVLYTIFSKKLFKEKWQTYEILSVRSILMVILSFCYISLSDVSLSLNIDMILPMLILVAVGHLLPIYLVLKAINAITPLHVSLLFLLIPVFTILFQYLDSRIAFSVESLIAASVIVSLLIILGVSKIKKTNRV
ncbi:EamA family transporter [Photorhabdus laumondii subsp. laumondii]|uniref:Photorhabdus luminescens subsp. laumondii TTO1 complete genome segment 1/17 n=2 Tax=Photorhabdus laumondii subsp. laumondii TaxID=141679 RepID=Q7N9M3_PHOLL|nr:MULTISPECIES: EamA family transporter [Photorhabdus]AWK40280.1 transporter [Photorhabdus laumondii subsp. laumondii]AXG41114.1 transporter [Photorhabdus laumondii subsp. laumondii]AXG45627.1 transporter [Photorhabdus laumondii subsp. laumondii]MCC8382185.1 EamA family transporter [Photorhabdus laumondii]MCC8414859.1 EamA family transporter [Photorhabdus laumondii]